MEQKDLSPHSLRNLLFNDQLNFVAVDSYIMYLTDEYASRVVQDNTAIFISSDFLVSRVYTPTFVHYPNIFGWMSDLVSESFCNCLKLKTLIWT